MEALLLVDAAVVPMRAGTLRTITWRSLQDSAGKVWIVREAEAIDVPGAQRKTCLIFDGQTIMRRLWTYPIAWEDCADAALLSILEQPRPPLV